MKVDKGMMVVSFVFIVLSLPLYGFSQLQLAKVRELSAKANDQIYYIYRVLGREYKYPIDPYVNPLTGYMQLATLRLSVEVPFFASICSLITGVLIFCSAISEKGDGKR